MFDVVVVVLWLWKPGIAWPPCITLAVKRANICPSELKQENVEWNFWSFSAFSYKVPSGNNSWAFGKWWSCITAKEPRYIETVFVTRSSLSIFRSFLLPRKFQDSVVSLRYFAHQVLTHFFKWTFLVLDRGSAFAGEYHHQGFAFVPSWRGFKHKHASIVPWPLVLFLWCCPPKGWAEHVGAVLRCGTWCDAGRRCPIAGSPAHGTVTTHAELNQTSFAMLLLASSWSSRKVVVVFEQRVYNLTDVRPSLLGGTVWKQNVGSAGDIGAVREHSSQREGRWHRGGTTRLNASACRGRRERDKIISGRWGELALFSVS